jgi:hypothetical protein
VDPDPETVTDPKAVLDPDGSENLAGSGSGKIIPDPQHCFSGRSDPGRLTN